MFERRLKIFLLIVSLFGVFLLARAAQVQIVHRKYWVHQANEAMKLTHFVESTRGKIFDRNGKLLAVDKPCIDACIDYRALTQPPDPDWVKDRALERLKNRLGDQWAKLPGKQRVALRDQEIVAVNSDINQMWDRLALVSGRSIDEIEQTRADIVRRVDMRSRYVWYKRYEAALNKGEKKVETATWKKWVTDGGDDTPPVDNFHVVVAEQLESHVILPAVDIDVQNELGKDIDKYPGLILRPGTHRTYPYDDVACHLLGHLAHVDADNLKENKDKGLDELRAYLSNDLIGKTGVELLCEPALRGARGKIDRVMGDETILASKDIVEGQDVRLSIDVELQQQMQSVFASATLRDAAGKVIEENAPLHGAAVVLDVETNQVLALVSYPTFNLNLLDEQYPKLRDDEINDPLRNRATMSQLEPGSTAKPLCGLAGISAGVVGVNEGIECTGYMMLDGRKIQYGRCWVASMFEHDPRVSSVAHHPVPFPHVGHDGNADGWLTFSDALERSCNVYHETVADRLGIDRLSEWYEKFGLGRPTGIGIGEVKGRLPRDFPVQLQVRRRITGFLGGIGQGYIAATPIQMANAASMIARDGIWMRPRLVIPGKDGRLPAMRPGNPGAWQDIPDRVDLHIPPEAIKAAKLGMFNVVNGRAGTGKGLVAGDKMLQALGADGKTGTAQAARFSVIERDKAGKIVYDEHHKPKRRFIEPSTPDHPNPEAPWYRATVSRSTVETSPGVMQEVEKLSLDHAWYIGFAPADHPKIAFAVMVEYGGSGGIAAASVAREALEACIARGYLPTPPQEVPPTVPQARGE